MTLSNKQLRAGLKANVPSPRMRDKGEFWADFQARSQWVPHGQADGSRDVAAVIRHPWALLAGTTAILLAAGFLGRWLWPEFRSPPMAELSTVEEIDVYAECQSVLVFQDENSHATLVWLAGLDATGANPGGIDHERL